MNYKEAVERKLAGETTDLNKRKELWGKLATAYERSGEGGIKSVLTKHADKITKEFEELLDQLRRKLWGEKSAFTEETKN